MLNAAAAAFAQALSPPMRALVLKSLALTVAILLLAVAGLVALFGALVALPGWLETTIQVMGGLALIAGSVFLVAPITSLIAGLWLDDVAEAVERAHYAGDPPGKALPALASAGLAVRFGLVVAGVNVLALLLLLIPGVNLVALIGANGYLLGREYFEMVAFRHMPLNEARALRRAHAGRVFLAGLLIAGFVAVPLLNLLTPVFATAFMTHIFKDTRRRAAAREASLARVP